MKTALILIAAVLLASLLALGLRPDPPSTAPASGSPPSSSLAVADTQPAAESYQGFLYGRVTTPGGVTHEGRLRFGGDQEAFWSDYFNGTKFENPWLAQVPAESLPMERYPVEIFGVKVAEKERALDFNRLFMARLGEIARIEASRREVQVTLKSGTEFVLDRFAASDFDDGLRMWDSTGNAIDLDSLQIRTIELLPAPSLDDAAPYRLHGTVRTRQGEFSGFIQWNRQDCVGTDELAGQVGDSEIRLRFDTVRSIARHSHDSTLVTLLDGREMVLSGTSEAGDGNRGLYVDDPRYGRVLVSWDAFERVDFGPGGGGPAFGDFPAGRPLAGSVTTRDGRRLAGRLVYDLDESETTETLDAPSRGVDYTIPFGLVASIVLPAGEPGGDVRGDLHARVTLHNGEELQLDRTGDLGGRNAGMLVFVTGLERPEYVPWTSIERVDFDAGLPPGPAR